MTFFHPNFIHYSRVDGILQEEKARNSFSWDFCGNRRKIAGGNAWRLSFNGKVCGGKKMEKKIISEKRWAKTALRRSARKVPEIFLDCRDKL
jgi:hypothetical protein